MTDVVIAGGGPAGAATAIFLGRMGFSVELCEARRFPRDKACGEGIMPAGVAVLERLGLADAVNGARYRGVRYLGFDTVVEASFPGVHASPGQARDAYGMGQRRTVLDTVLLREAAVTPGVRVRENVAVESVLVRRGRAVGLSTSDREIRAGLVVGADGPRSVVRRTLGLDGQRVTEARAGLRVHYRLRPEESAADVVEIYVGRDHELYVTPLPDRHVLVAALAARESLAHAQASAGLQRPRPDGNDEGVRGSLVDRFPRWVAEHPKLAEHLRGADRVSRPAGRFPLAHRARSRIFPGGALLGDAAGFTDPITGGGIAQALLSAELFAQHAARILDGGDEWLWRFDRRRQSMLRDYAVLTEMILALTRHPRLAGFALRALRARPGVMQHLVGVAAGVRRLLPGLRVRHTASAASGSRGDA